MNFRLQGYTAAVLATVPAEEISAVTSDLTAVDNLFQSNATLRMALSDTSVAPAARQAVIEDLLASRVRPAAARLVRFAVGSSRATDIPAAVSWLADDATGDAEPLGHGPSRDRLGGFADALYEGMDVAALEEMEDELFHFARVIETNSALRAALGDRNLPTTVRRGVVDDLLGGMVTDATRKLVNYVAEAGRPRDMVGSLSWLVDRAAAARGWRVARVGAAREVASEERTKLENTLGRMAGHPVDLQVTIEPELLAGVLVRIGDVQVDATARGRIDELREHMASGVWQDQGFGKVHAGGSHAASAAGSQIGAGAGNGRDVGNGEGAG